MVTLQNITKEYGERTVLDIPYFAFKSGRRYAVIGANGSGKTTALRIMAGALEPTSGRVEHVDGVRGGLGYMPQKSYAFGFSVLKNVTIALHGMEKAGAEAAAREALGKVNMLGFAEAKGSGLSGGETQRLALARMLAKKRPLLLLDEPTSATDISGIETIEAALLEYCEQTGCTLIFSTHSPVQATNLAQEIIMLDNGRIVESGSAAQVLYQPRSEQGKRFLRRWKL